MTDKKVINFTLDADTHRRFKAMAAMAQIPVNALLRKLVAEYLADKVIPKP